MGSLSPRAPGFATNWWYDWVDRRRIAGLLVIGVIATQVPTYFGYVLPAFGLPTLPWPLYNGALGLGTFDTYNTAGSFFVGQNLHYINGIVFVFLYALLLHPILPGRNTSGGNVIKGLTYAVVMTIISIGVLVPYAYVPKQGYGFFSFYGPNTWKLPLSVLLWHLFYGFLIGVLYQPREEVPATTTTTTSTMT
jgi:hypothetical protein